MRSEKLGLLLLTVTLAKPEFCSVKDADVLEQWILDTILYEQSGQELIFPT
jgi:hypothetical protein